MRRNPAESRQSKGKSKACLPASEVLLQFPRGRVQPGRGLQDPRADLVRERLEHGVVVFAGVGDPDQALFGRGQQQRADRAVEDAVGDIQGALPLGRRGQPVVQPAQLAGRFREGLRQVTGHAVGAHRDLSFHAVAHRLPVMP